MITIVIQLEGRVNTDKLNDHRAKPILQINGNLMCFKCHLATAHLPDLLFIVKPNQSLPGNV